MKTAFTTVLILLTFIPLSTGYPGDDKEKAIINKSTVTSVGLNNSVSRVETNLIINEKLSQEGFEGILFPPQGWSTANISGSQVWERSEISFHTGTASALIASEVSGGEDWLISPPREVISTDTLSFWMRPVYAGSDDTLSVLYSTTGSATASFLSTLIKITADTLNSLWRNYKIPMDFLDGENVYIAFKHTDTGGGGLYLDDYSFGTPYDSDVAPLSIDIENTLKVIGLIPRATVTNAGLISQSFLVTMETEPGDYSSTKIVANLEPYGSAQVTFDELNFPQPGSYEIIVYTELPGDSSRQNDTLRMQVEVYDILSCGEWFSETDMPDGRWGHALAVYSSGVEPNDTVFVLVIGGVNSSFALTSRVERYNTRTFTWDTAASLPLNRYQMSAVRIGNSIYVPGGFVGGFSPDDSLFIYNIETNSWSGGANMPTAVGDYAIGTYGDSLIYVISGYGNSGGVDLVQIYNVNTDTWSTGTPKPGPGLLGLRGAISGNIIVVAGGYSQSPVEVVDDVSIGSIDPENPASIIWEESEYPSGPIFRPAAGILNSYFQGVIFAGGDPVGNGTDAETRIWGYDIQNENWVGGPDLPEGLNNLHDLACLERNDTLYMVNVGGYDGAAASVLNLWFRVDEQEVSVTDSPSLVDGFSIFQNYPNPFNPSTVIRYQIPEDGFVSLKVYDILGKEISTLLQEDKTSGSYEVTFNGSELSSGVYFCRINLNSASGRFTSVKKMILMK